MFLHCFHFSSFSLWQMNNCNFVSPCFRLVADAAVHCLKTVPSRSRESRNFLWYAIEFDDSGPRARAFSLCVCVYSVMPFNSAQFLSAKIIRIHWNWIGVKCICLGVRSSLFRYKCGGEMLELQCVRFGVQNKKGTVLICSQDCFRCQFGGESVIGVLLFAFID